MAALSSTQAGSLKVARQLLGSFLDRVLLFFCLDRTVGASV